MFTRRRQLEIAALLSHVLLNGSEAVSAHTGVMLRRDVSEAVTDGVPIRTAFDNKNDKDLLSPLARGLAEDEEDEDSSEWSPDIFVHLDYGDDPSPPASEEEPSPPPPAPSPEEEPSPPPPAPAPEEEPVPEPVEEETTVFSCDDESSSNVNYDSVLAEFEYNIETNSEDPGEAEGTIARLLEELLVEEVGKEQCSRRRKLELVEVSTTHEDRCEGTCVASDGSLSCSSCRGEVWLEYTNQGANNDADTVTQNALGTIKAKLDSGELVPIINGMLNKARDAGVQATVIEYTGPKLNAVIASSGQEIMVEEAQDGSTTITPGGKAVIGLISFFTFCVLLLLCCMWRKRANSSKTAGGDDSKSLRTNASSQGDDNSYADFHDLARKHTNMDVHQCNSATCRACNPLSLEDFAKDSNRSHVAGNEIQFVSAEPRSGKLPPVTLLDLDLTEVSEEGEISEDALPEYPLANEAREMEEWPPAGAMDIEDPHIDSLSTEEDLEGPEEDLEGSEEDNQEVTLGDELDLTGEPSSQPRWRRFGRGKKAKSTEDPVVV